MNKTKFKYVKYTKQELDRYVRDKNSCITLTNSDMHVGFPPWGFANFQETLTNVIARDKIGKYDAKLNGIVLEVRNIKVFGTAYPVHDDDPYNHINIKANFYVFQPRVGATIKGIVKHISHGHVAVIIYRVFNVSIRFNRTTVQDTLKINQQISFRIKKFDLQGAMPYIEGELIEIDMKLKPQNSKKHLKIETDVENTVNGGDSGISTEENDERTPNYKQIETDSSSDEDSESESNQSSNHGLVNGLFPNVKIKQEKLSDSEEESRSKVTVKAPKIDSESDDTSSSDEPSDSDESTEVRVKQEKISPECSSSSESSDDESTETPISQHKIKKEKNVEKSTKPVTFIPRPIKVEPESDVECTTKFKKPTTYNKNSPNTSEKSTKTQKRKRNSSISEHLDSIADNLLNTTKSEKRKKSKSNDKSVDETFDDSTHFQTPDLSSTLKIKQEPQSEDESAKRIKKSKRSSNNSKSLKSMESDLFDSFLK